MKKKQFMLGTGLSHNRSTCLIKDGKIVSAIEKGRITRIKHNSFNDDLAIKYCLSCEGVTVNDLSLIIQTVTREWNILYFELLTELKRLTGVDVLLNTLFNIRFTPTVETPKQALSFFFECKLGYLIQRDYIITK